MTAQFIRSSSIALLMLIAAPNLYSAEEATTKLPQVVVTADKREQPLGDTPASVTIISRQDIERQAADTVPEVLRHTPGIDVVSIGSPGDDLDIRIRGSDRDEVLVLIDGVPINNIREHRASFLSSIPLDNVERIEIVRGSQSVLYGSDAVGGVINIITRTGSEDPRYFVGVEAGTLQRFKETVGVSGHPGDTRYSLTVSRTDQRGRFTRDRFGELALSANIGRKLTPEVDLQFGFNYLHTKQELFYEFLTGFDAGTGTVLVRIDPDNNRRITRDLMTGRLALKAYPFPWWQLQFHYGIFLDMDRVLNPTTGDTAPTGFAVGTQDFKGEGISNTLDLRNFFTLYESSPFIAELLVGFEFQDERLNFVDTGTVFPGPGQSGDRQNVAPYAQVSFRLLDESLIITGGARFDRNTTFGTELSPRASILYKLKSTGTRFRGSYAEGFHAPTILEFFTQTLLRDLGNPLFQAVRLQEELTQSYEVGIDQELWDWGEISATFFYVDYDRLFDELQFIQDAFTTGGEAGITIRPWDFLTIGGNYTFLHARDQTNGRRLPNRPRHHINAHVEGQPIEDLSLRVDMNFVSSRRVPDRISTSAGDLPFVFIDQNGNTTTGTVGSYFKLNFAASYTFLKNQGPLHHLKTYLRIDNVLNRNYQEKFGFPSPGITVRGGAQATF